MTITRNKCLDELKSRKKEHYSWDDNLDRVEEQTPFIQSSISDETAWVRKLMQDLPQDQREVFYLRHFEGNSYKEISDNLRLSESKVKVYLHRARSFIKRSLEEKHDYGLKTG